MSEGAKAFSTVLKLIISSLIGLAIGIISARAIYLISLRDEQKRWVKDRQQLYKVQRGKLEIDRRRLLRTNPTLKLDNAEDVLRALQGGSRERLQVFWEYFIPRDVARRLRWRMRLVGIGAGIFATLVVFYLLLQLGL